VQRLPDILDIGQRERENLDSGPSDVRLDAVDQPCGDLARSPRQKLGPGLIDAWLQPARYLLPFRLLAWLREREAVILDLRDHGEATTVVARGHAPPEIWRALAALEG
jgi:hypothetical protein